jgi:hypothetical protein
VVRCRTKNTTRKKARIKIKIKDSSEVATIQIVIEVLIIAIAIVTAIEEVTVITRTIVENNNTRKIKGMYKNKDTEEEEEVGV